MTTELGFDGSPTRSTASEGSDTTFASRGRSSGAPHRAQVLVGVICFLLVLVVRWAGVIVGPIAVVVAALCFVLAPGPRRLSDRFILFFAIGFGWLMVLGWIPRLETTIDLPGILLAIVFGLAAANQFRDGRFRWSVRQWPLPTETAAFVIGAVTMLWWAAPFLRLSLSGRLKALFPGWDDSAFVDMFKQILVHGSFKSIPSPQAGEGLPQTWALLVRLWSPHPPTTVHWTLNAYDTVLLLTGGAIVTLGCMSVARLCGHNFWLALPAMAVVVEVFVLGRLWIVSGAPTFVVPVAAVTAAVLWSWRTESHPWVNFVVLAGLTLVAAYTWFPLILLSAPALAVASWQLFRTSSGRARCATLVLLGGSGIALLGPYLHFRNEAHKFSNSYTSNFLGKYALFVAGTPWVLVVVSVVGLLAFVIIDWLRSGDRGRLVLLAAPVVLGALGVLGLVISERRASHEVTYYGHKWATGVGGMCIVVLVTVVVSSLKTSKIRSRLPAVAKVALACAASIAMLEIDGYVGPFANAKSVTLAKGFAAHKTIATAALRSREAQQIITSAQFALDQRASGTRWLYVDPDGHVNCGLAAEWFFALSGETFVNRSYGEWNFFPCRLGPGPGRTDLSNATYIVSNYRDPVASHIHIFVPASLAQAIIAQDQEWSAPGVLHILKTY